MIFKPVILSPIYKTVFKNLELGDSILFTINGEENFTGNFAGYRIEDTGITLYHEIRKFLKVEPGEVHIFNVDIDKKLFSLVAAANTR